MRLSVGEGFYVGGSEIHPIQQCRSHGHLLPGVCHGMRHRVSIRSTLAINFPRILHVNIYQLLLRVHVCDSSYSYIFILVVVDSWGTIYSWCGRVPPPMRLSNGVSARVAQK
jgi:hypothetical protein